MSKLTKAQKAALVILEKARYNTLYSNTKTFDYRDPETREIEKVSLRTLRVLEREGLVTIEGVLVGRGTMRPKEWYVDYTVTLVK